jgi:hypothetical protein
MPDQEQDKKRFQQFAEAVELESSSSFRAPSRLKARIYSALMLRESAAAPLRSMAETKAAGHGLCVFEELVRIAPVGEKLQSFNICRLCHARVLAENLEKPPIYWGNCPYTNFKKS